ncbi:MAG TPA: class I SAM-dependent methyltransferase [Pseudonocardiaceae bacterium]|jgi:SAM-dependent methyltransferase
MTHPAHQHGQADILDLDADVLAEQIAAIVASLPVETSPTRIVDLGAGTGAGTFALLDRFPDAQVAAVDASPEHLHRLRDKAHAAGLADRVWTVQADLDADWPDLGRPDLVWASASLHHMADPDRTLRQVHDVLVPGGVLAVVELASFPRFLPDGDLADLEERAHAASEREHAGHLPHRGADWGPKLTAAGFTDLRERTINVRIGQSDAVTRHAQTSLSRIRGAATLPADDLATLDRLLDPADPRGIAHRDDLVLRTERTVWIASRG